MPSTRSYGPTPPTGAIPPAALNTILTAQAPLPASVVAGVVTEQVLLQPGSALPLVVNIPSGSVLEQRQFEIYASGRINTAAIANCTIKLYSGSSLTLGSDVLIGTSGAVSVTGGAPWILRGNGVYDSVSGKLTGTVEFLVNNAITAKAAFSAIITNVTNSSPLGAAVASFLLTYTCSVANALNVLNVQEFCVAF